MSPSPACCACCSHPPDTSPIFRISVIWLVKCSATLSALSWARLASLCNFRPWDLTEGSETLEAAGGGRENISNRFQWEHCVSCRVRLRHEHRRSFFLGGGGLDIPVHYLLSLSTSLPLFYASHFSLLQNRRGHLKTKLSSAPTAAPTYEERKIKTSPNMAMVSK